ncbi:MAG TPA: RNA methyltransferase [Pyrinomonadaceae bacterium]
MQITSRDNSLLRQARAVRDGRVDDLIYIEGLRLAEESLRSELEIEAVIFSEELARKERASEALEKIAQASARVGSVSEKLLESISFTKTPQGIVVLARRPPNDSANLKAKLNETSLLVVLHQINNPVNVGAIIRTAEAAGVSGMIATKHTTDPFSPKALRGAMGSAFRLPIWSDVNYDELIEWCRSTGITTVASALSSAVSHTEIDWTRPTALILGPESTGLNSDEIAAAALTVRIPMAGEVESLNVSVAAGVLLFEAARQRGFKS